MIFLPANCRLPLNNYFCISLKIRRDARAVEWGGLENRCPRKRTQGSNPCLSAEYLFELPACYMSDQAVNLLHNIQALMLATPGS
jgi:hypothetical protein